MKLKLLTIGAIALSQVGMNYAYSQQVPEQDFFLECLHQDLSHNPKHTLFVFYKASNSELVIQTTQNRIKTGNYVAKFDEIISPPHSNAILNMHAHISDGELSQRFNVFLNKNIKKAGLITASFNIHTGYVESGSSQYYKTCAFKNL